MRYGELTYEEIAERAGAGWIALVPTGCTEQQGPHLPVDMDTWFAETVCTAAADMLFQRGAVKALVLPALPFGPTPEHRGFNSGYIDLPQELHEGALTAVFRSLADQGFRVIVVWRGCGGHALDKPVEEFNRERAGQARAFNPEPPYADIWGEIGNPGNVGGHADAFLTSIALFLRPDSVRRKRIENPENRAVDWQDPDLDLSQHSRTGVIGDPTEATAELGEKLWHAVVDRVAGAIEGLVE